MTRSTPLHLGSARAATQADTIGDKMELVPQRRYFETALGLGSARGSTQASGGGDHLELVPGQYWAAAGVSSR